MNNEQKEQLIATKTGFWTNVQIPHTRLSNPQLLYDLAEMSYNKFDDLDIKASAICTMIYRVIENPAALIQKNDFNVIKNAEHVIPLLASDKSFSGIRWLISLNMALAFWYIKIHNDIPKAMSILQRNFKLLDAALAYGQPFTNVVKSVGLWVACAKQYKDRLILTEESLAETLSLFENHGQDITKNYTFNNEWVYGELATVFNTLSAISRCFYRYKRGEVASLAESLETFDLLPNRFYNALK